jgi:hypothetical protein
LDATKPDALAFSYILVAIWSSFVLAEQLCISFLLMLKNRMNAAISVTYILCVCLALASGTVRYVIEAKSFRTFYFDLFSIQNFIYKSIEKFDNSVLVTATYVNLHVKSPNSIIISTENKKKIIFCGM